MYKVEIKKGKLNTRTSNQWMLILKFKNGKVFMHSEYYKNKSYAYSLAWELRHKLDIDHTLSDKRKLAV